MSAELLRYYARRAQEYEEIYAKPERQSDLDRVRAWLHDELSGCRLLELACGTGYWTERLAPVTKSILATDAAAEVLEIARKKAYPPGRVRFAIADAYDLPALAGALDAALAGFWWSHVPLERLPSFLRGLHGRLGPTARVVFVDNRYVPGSSTAIARRDAGGNTYQQRRLAGGGEQEILKNFPTAAEIATVLEPGSSELRIMELEYYWGVSYRIGPAAKTSREVG
ncbi:MAG TPA: class I SAM-dependent methyltransferase [Thermoanaerobaculia bacterium]|nr:class I SAM-dependent methyltransferase [Thermoanaerobaculia bacterium]